MDRSSLRPSDFAALSTFMASKLWRTRSCFYLVQSEKSACELLESKRKRGIVGAGAMTDG